MNWGAPWSLPAHVAAEAFVEAGRDVNETLEQIPRRFIVVETVREKFTCRDCEAISQPPALFHATPRGFIVSAISMRIDGHGPADPPLHGV